MAEIQTSTAPTRGDNTSIKGAETEYSALEVGAQKRIQVLDQSIKNYLKQEGTSTGALDAFFGTSDAQLAMANSDHKLIKAMQAERLALTKKLEQAQELNKSGKTQEAKALLGSKHKRDLSQAQAEQRAVGAVLDRSLENIETATVITQRVKDGAVMAAATVATVMTAGAGSGALVAIAAGTSAGTIVGGAANSSEAWSHVEHGTKTKEQAILDACTQTQDHALDSFKSSVTSMIGAGVAAKQVAKLAQAGASTAKIAATKALTQGSVSSLSSSSYDTAMSYQQAVEDFDTQYAAELKTAKPEEIAELRDKFFAERKLDAASITRNLSVATLSGAASAYGGSKIPGPLDKAITSTGVSLARGSAIVAADTAVGTAVGLGSAALKGETLNRDAVIGEVTSNVVSALSGTASAHAKPRNEFAPTAAKPRIDISSTDGPSSATTTTKPGETRPSHTDIKLNKPDDLHHEILHSTQAGIDPQHADGKHMPHDEYIAKRALQELEARPQSAEHTQLKQLIDSGKHKEAADLAALKLSAADLKQYQDDYQANISRKVGEAVRQKNYNSTTEEVDKAQSAIKSGSKKDIKMALTDLKDNEAQKVLAEHGYSLNPNTRELELNCQQAAAHILSGQSQFTTLPDPLVHPDFAKYKEALKEFGLEATGNTITKPAQTPSGLNKSELQRKLAYVIKANEEIIKNPTGSAYWAAYKKSIACQTDIDDGKLFKAVTKTIQNPPATSHCPDPHAAAIDLARITVWKTDNAGDRIITNFTQVVNRCLGMELDISEEIHKVSKNIKKPSAAYSGTCDETEARLRFSEQQQKVSPKTDRNTNIRSGQDTIATASHIILNNGTGVDLATILSAGSAGFTVRNEKGKQILQHNGNDVVIHFDDGPQGTSKVLISNDGGQPKLLVEKTQSQLTICEKTNPGQFAKREFDIVIKDPKLLAMHHKGTLIIEVKGKADTLWAKVLSTDHQNPGDQGEQLKAYLNTAKSINGRAGIMITDPQLNSGSPEYKAKEYAKITEVLSRVYKGGLLPSIPREKRLLVFDDDGQDITEIIYN